MIKIFITTKSNPSFDKLRMSEIAFKTSLDPQLKELALGTRRILMKKKLLLLVLCMTCLLHTTNIFASFFGSSLTKDIGTGYAAKWNAEGTYLATGGADVSDDVIVYGWDGTYLSQITTADFGNQANDVAWTSDGKFLAVAGDNSTDNVIVYSWDGASLTVTDSQHHGTEANAVAWDPTDSYLAVGGTYGNLDLIVYSWDGSTLTPLDSVYWSYFNGLDWHPDGNFLAVAGYYEPYVGVYSWANSTLSSQDLTGPAGGVSFSVAWSYNGNYLAVTGDASNSGLIVYSWDGASLTETASAYHGTAGNSVTWSHDDRYVCVGGDNGSDDIAVHAFDGSNLTKAYSSLQSFGTAAYSVDFSPYSDFLAVAGDNSSSDLTVYGVDAFLNGRSKNIIKDDHYLFNDGGSIDGSVQLKNGFTLGQARGLTVDSLLPIGGGLDLRDTGTLQLEGDLYLDSSATFSDSGYISGKGHTLFLGGNMTIPDEKIIYIDSDLAIDGQGYDLTLGRWSQLIVDTNATLTLKNMTVKNSINSFSYPPIKCSFSNTKLALDNVEIAFTNDFWFTQGQLFVHNDVVFTGTSRFIYRTHEQSYIAPNSTLFFDHYTTLFFDTVSTTSETEYLGTGDINPYPTNNKLIQLQDTTSALHFDGCTFQLSHKGLRLTKGKVFFENDVTIKNDESREILSITARGTDSFTGDGRSVAWHPNGRFLAAATEENNKELKIYSFNGTSITEIDYVDTGGFDEFSVDWSPDGQYLAAGGSSSSDVRIYEWNGSSLSSAVATADTLGSCQSASWSPDGKYLAASGAGTIYVYEWDVLTQTLTEKKSESLGNNIYFVSWSRDGNYLASGGYNSSDYIRIHQWDPLASTLILKDSREFTTVVDHASWHPNGRHLAVGGTNATGGLTIYEWNGSQLALIKGQGFSRCFAVPWSPNGRDILAAGANSSNDWKIYEWDGSTTLTEKIAGGEFGSGPANFVRSAAWSPDGNYIALAGEAGGGDNIEVYQVNYSTVLSTPDTENALSFGNSSAGSDSDLDVKVLGNARVDVQAYVNYDNAA